VLRLPLAGRLVRARQTADFTRTLAILTSSAVPLVEALRVASGVVVNQVARQDIERAAAQVREGVSLTRALENSDWLPPMARRLIAGGEKQRRTGPDAGTRRRHPGTRTAISHHHAALRPAAGS
jgi:general secretion pathway protein F